jgi:hypothetical protein
MAAIINKDILNRFPTHDMGYLVKKIFLSAQTATCQNKIYDKTFCLTCFPYTSAVAAPFEKFREKSKMELQYTGISMAGEDSSCKKNLKVKKFVTHNPFKFRLVGRLLRFCTSA